MTPINLLVKLQEKITNYSEIKVINNRVGNDVKLKIEDMIVRAMKDYRPYGKDETLANFKSLVSILPDASIKEMIATGLIEKTWRRDVWVSKSTNQVISSLALIFKFDEAHMRKYKLKKNTVVLTCSTEINNNKEFLNLKRLDFLNLPLAEVDDPFVQRIPNDWTFNVIVSEKDGASMTPVHDFWATRNRLKTIFFEDDGASLDKNLHVRQWNDFLRSFKSFLKEKRDSGSYKAFSLVDCEAGEEKIIIEAESDISKILDADPSLNFSLVSDPSMKFTARVTSFEAFDFKSYISNIITGYMNEVNDLTKNIALLSSDIKNKELEYQTENAKYKKEFQVGSEISSEVKELEMFLKSLQVMTDKITIEISNLKSIKNKNDSKEKVTSRNDVINLKTIELKNLTDQKNSTDKQLANVKSRYREAEKTYKQLNDDLKRIETVINNLGRDRNDFVMKQETLSKTIQTLTKTIGLVSDKYFFECGIHVKEMENSEIFEMNAFDFESFVNLSYDAEDIYWEASTYDDGFAKIFMRYSDGFSNLIGGSYRNPYLVTSLNSPSGFRTSMNRDNPNYINYKKIGSLSLNEKQVTAVESALNTSSIAFLQGPPGTGKTQVISGLVLNLINKGENILISSSTHEAINNAFDRIREKGFDNPNLFFLKMLSGNRLRNKEWKPEEIGYSEDKFRFNFFNAIDEFVTKKNNDNNDELKNIIKKLISYEDIELEKAFSKKALEKLLTQEYESTDNLKFLEKYYVDNDLRSFFDKQPDSYIKKFIDNDLRMQEEMLHGEVGENISRFHLLIEDFYSPSTDELFNNKELILKIKKIIHESQKNNIAAKFKFLNEKLRNDYDKHKVLNSNFARAVFDNELINVIGITTTAPQQIIVDGEKRMLFTDYQIDYEIIDEVSKSSTAELINASILSGRVLYCGDYRQIQPQDTLTDNVLFEEWKETEEDVYEGLHPKPEELIKTPIFKQLALQLVDAKENQTYRFLNEQHRFTNNIMNVVNEIYLENEHLVMPENKNNFDRYEFNYKGTRLKEDTTIIDTTYLPEKDRAFFKENGITVEGEYSFDSRKSLLLKGRTFQSRVNEVDARCVIELLDSMFEKDIAPNKIGVITITRSQAQLIKALAQKSKLKNKDLIQKVIIDTVDNFQGREKEIIIVDFVNAGNLLKLDSKTASPAKGKRNDFLSEVERLNVAISRAKNKLIMIGSFDYYKGLVSSLDIGANAPARKVYLFQRWIEIVKEQGGLYKQWKDMQ